MFQLRHNRRMRQVGNFTSVLEMLGPLYMILGAPPGVIDIMPRGI